MIEDSNHKSHHVSEETLHGLARLLADDAALAALLAFDSGMLAGLPGPVLTPHCYGVTEREAGGWI